MPRSDSDSPRRRRRKDLYRSRDSRSTSKDRRESRERDRHRRRDSGSRRRSLSSDRRKSRDRSPTSHPSGTSHRSKRRSSSRHRSQSDYKSSRHRRNRSSSSSESSESTRSSHSKSRSRKRSSSTEIVTQFPEIAPSRTINLESATNEEKRRQMIDEIDADNFEPKTFKTSKKVSEKVIIDLQNQTISVPQVESKRPDADEIIHPSFLGNDDERMEKWVKKLFIYRQRHSDQV